MQNKDGLMIPGHLLGSVLMLHAGPSVMVRVKLRLGKRELFWDEARMRSQRHWGFWRWMGNRLVQHSLDGSFAWPCTYERHGTSDGMRSSQLLVSGAEEEEEEAAIMSLVPPRLIGTIVITATNAMRRFTIPCHILLIPLLSLRSIVQQASV